MYQLFARVELRGNPSVEIYQKLHEYMKGQYWYTTITGTATATLPHATYQATYTTKPEVLAIANQLKAGIESNVWTRALVLVIEASYWAETAG
jgi:hypothetical protein